MKRNNNLSQKKNGEQKSSFNINREREKNIEKFFYSFLTVRDHFQHISHASDLIVFFNSKVISPPIF
jgi:hypothetical protein